jgi:hypothetical protein
VTVNLPLKKEEGAWKIEGGQSLASAESTAAMAKKGP